MFVVPLFALLFDPVTAFSILVILMLTGQLRLFARAVRKAYWKQVAPVVVPSAIAMSCGILFLVSADPTFVRQGMVVFVLLITVFMMFGYRYAGKRRTLVGVATGSVAGGTTDSFGVPAFPLSAIYFHNSAAAPELFRANVLTAFCSTSLVAISDWSCKASITRRYCCGRLSSARSLPREFIWDSICFDLHPLTGSGKSLTRS